MQFNKRIFLVVVISVLFGFSGSFFASLASSSTAVSFGVIQNVSNNGSGNSTAPVVAAVGTHVYVAWEEKPASNKHIATYFVASNDQGNTWGPLLVFDNMAGGANPQTSAVQIAAEGQYVFLTWEQGGQTAYAISSNNGETFPTNGTFTTGVPAGTMSGESVSASGSYGYFSWADVPTGSKAHEIVFVQVHDSGSGIFSIMPAKVISGGSSTHGEDEIKSSGNNVVVVWDSIWAVNSSSNGNKFSSPKQLNTGTSGGSLSREPMLAFCGSNVYATFLSKNASNVYNAWVAVSNNKGGTFAAAKELSASLSTIREVQVNCNANDVYITSRGESPAVSGTQQYVYVSQNRGATFSAPMLAGQQKLPNPENGFGGIAVSGNNAYITWVHNNVSKGVQQVFVSASEDNGTTWAPRQQVSNSATGVIGYGDPAGGQGPLIAAIPSAVFLVWEDNSAGNGQIMFVAGSPPS